MNQNGNSQPTVCFPGLKYSTLLVKDPVSDPEKHQKLVCDGLDRNWKIKGIQI